MKNKEKALELFNKCKLYILDTYPYENVKSVAKIICYEIEKSMGKYKIDDPLFCQYWIDVKKEIDLINWETLSTK